MGELHLQIYVERMKREYDCDTITGMPQVRDRDGATRNTDNSHLQHVYMCSLSHWLIS